MTEARHVGVGIIGLGFGRSVHLPAFRLLAPLGVEVVALCSRNLDGARAVATDAGITLACDDWRQLIANPDVDLVSVATPPGTHFAPAFAALAAGKAVLCEKPLALDTGEAERLVQAAETSGRPAAVNFSYRALPAFAAARDALAAQAVGPIRLAEVSWHVGTRLAPHTTRSWKDDAHAGGGALASYGVHALDYLTWLLGPVERLFARLDHRTSGDGTSDDSCVILLDHAGGTRSSITVSLASAAERVHRIVFRGERGRLVIENTDPLDPVRPFGTRIELVGHPPHQLPMPEVRWLAPTDVDGRIEPLAAHAAALVEALRGARATFPTFADGLAAQRLMTAAISSDRDGAWLDLPVSTS
jgi:predicted dehydrogenase